MANGRLSLMAYDDLRLSLEESIGIAKLKGCGRLEDRTIAKIHTKCEGWAAGLVLLLELSKCHSIEDLLSIDEKSCQKIFDYFSGEVFECLDAPMRTLLLRTAFLPKITPEAAQGLTGFDSAEEMLATLASKPPVPPVRAYSLSNHDFHALRSCRLSYREPHSGQSCTSGRPTRV